MITIKSIAKEANVSEGTVDRVLHDRGGVSKKTEERVKKILKKHNFKVNPVARALAMKNKFNLLTLMPNYDRDNLFWKSPYLGILEASAEVKNYGVTVINYFFDQFDSDSYLNQFEALMDAKPSAVVIVPTFAKETKQIVDRLEKLEIPYLFFNIDLEGFDNISFIGQDSYMGGYVAGKLMHLSLGDQTSSLIVQSRLNVNNYYAISKRIEGFNDYFKKNKIKNECMTLSIDNLNDAAYTKEKINSFLEQHDSIKGIFVPSSRISTIVEAIKDSSLKKCQLIGFDNTEQNIQCLENDSVSFLISQKPFEQGYESIRLMTDFLVKHKKPADKIYSPIDILTKENARYNERNEREFQHNDN
ncbi:LacI family DNA-binding transcriptional regulator [Lutimonas halocynthiae]|uniref:LacI family DNA-binding transcriptional regulator n=1 Tax=Lutimonas halocynthiae TaxID=1446477 RepID=UPI0025B501D5|nr:LacI family DNA-binding transcriptional regulator [Lutimonas halocynthiae]MDN3641833.1 LacI family DNA-binding transcriptional regulator [Lutimonas halocynthiae]